jgi:hypothetical protein
MGLISDFWDTLKQVFTRPPYATPCTGNCNQGRNCTCATAPDLETQRKHQLDDEFNNANWPFPVGPKP